MCDQCFTMDKLKVKSEICGVVSTENLRTHINHTRAQSDDSAVKDLICHLREEEVSSGQARNLTIVMRVLV